MVLSVLYEGILVSLDAKLGLYVKESVSGVSSVGEMAILKSSMEKLDGVYMKESVSGISSVGEMMILISSMENRRLYILLYIRWLVSGETKQWCW